MRNNDYEIMLARTKARGRGASPLEVENNVLALSVVCAICGEYTGHCGSLTGLVHKWGPVDHVFTPIDEGLYQWARSEGVRI